MKWRGQKDGWLTESTGSRRSAAAESRLRRAIKQPWGELGVVVVGEGKRVGWGLSRRRREVESVS